MVPLMFEQVLLRRFAGTKDDGVLCWSVVLALRWSDGGLLSASMVDGMMVHIG